MTLNWPLVYPKRPFIDTNRIFCTLLFTEVVFTKYLYLDFFERQGWIELCRNFSINLIREQERLVNVLYGRPLLFGPMPGLMGRVISKIEQNFFFNKSLILIEFCLLIPDISPKVLNSVVKGDLNAFEVPLSYIGPLYKTRKIYLVESGPIFYREYLCS